jgi:hypothetical protein
MNTGQAGALTSLLYVAVLIACLPPAYQRVGGLGPLLRRPQPGAVALWLLVAVPSLVELGWPRVYDVLSRQPTLIGHGQLWRLITSVVVQDGGVIGTAYNLVTLGLTVPAAVALWRAGPALGLFLTGALVFNVPAAFVWHAAGGGNSSVGKPDTIAPS